MSLKYKATVFECLDHLAARAKGNQDIVGEIRRDEENRAIKALVALESLDKRTVSCLHSCHGQRTGEL